MIAFNSESPEENAEDIDVGRARASQYVEFMGNLRKEMERVLHTNESGDAVQVLEEFARSKQEEWHSPIAFEVVADKLCALGEYEAACKAWLSAKPVFAGQKVMELMKMAEFIAGRNETMNDKTARLLTKVCEAVDTDTRGLLAMGLSEGDEKAFLDARSRAEALLQKTRTRQQ